MAVLSKENGTCSSKIVSGRAARILTQALTFATSGSLTVDHKNRMADCARRIRPTAQHSSRTTPAGLRLLLSDDG
jgi:hypothetical protein